MKKLIKRGFAALLALTLALGMSVSAFAADGTAVAEKDYQLTNPDTTSPEETFTFTAEAANVTDATNSDGTAVTKEQMPHLTITVDKYNEGAAGSADCKHDLVVTQDKDFPSVGIYTYDVTETKGDTAGVTYNKEKLQLKVTVFHDVTTGALKVAYAFTIDGNKEKDLVNTYSAGTLQVGKHVDGNLGNKTQKFNFTVTFNAPEGKTVKSTISLTDGTQILPSEWKNGSVTKRISLADKETMEFKNVPYGVTYSVVEDKYDGYETNYGSDANGTIGDKGEKTKVAAVYNKKVGTVDTGVILHSAPYVLLLAGVGAAAVAFLILRKHREV